MKELHIRLVCYLCNRELTKEEVRYCKQCNDIMFGKIQKINT